MNEEVLPHLREAIQICVGKAWPVTLENSQTGERFRRPLFSDVQLQTKGDLIRVVGTFHDGMRRIVTVDPNTAAASPMLAAKTAIDKLKLSREAA